MNIVSTIIDGVSVVETKLLSDLRGDFARLFCAKELSIILNGRHILQINQSKTKQQGAIRGMHFQCKPFAEMKLIRCLKGKVFDVAVDLRKNSNTYLSWHAEILTPENATMFVVPEGCAHGFQVLEPDSELLYLHTAFYKPEYEGGILYDDPAVGIEWPIDCSEISDRDKQYTLINNGFTAIEL